MTAPSHPHTFAEFIAVWMDVHVRPRLAPKTAERYESLAAHLTRELGDTALGDLNAFALERTYAALRPSLSARTIRHIHECIHSALATAVRWDMLDRNAAAVCRLPSCTRPEARALGFAETVDLIVAAADTWVGPIVQLAAATGARRGELLALRWSDYNAAAGTITIHSSVTVSQSKLTLKSTKNRQSRIVHLPDSAISALRSHREQQDRNKHRFHRTYRLDLNLIFADTRGDYLRPGSVTRVVSRLARNAGLGSAGLHTLRHSHGSQLLAAGTPLPAVSRRLGHSNVYVTATVYSHVLAGDEIQAAKAWEQAMQSAAIRR
jgi:integrase